MGSRAVWGDVCLPGSEFCATRSACPRSQNERHLATEIAITEEAIMSCEVVSERHWEYHQADLTQTRQNRGGLWNLTSH